MEGERAHTSKRLPVVLSVDEVRRLMSGLAEGSAGMVVKLLYGCGLRVSEALSLRVKDVDWEGGKVEIRGGKGDKDRVVSMPKSLRDRLRGHLERVRLLYEQDRGAGVAGVYLPNALAVKYPQAGESWAWYWAFPAGQLSRDPRAMNVERRHHLHEISISREIARAVDLAQLSKKVTAHTMRHSFATHLILRGVDIRSVQDLLGHADVRTTEIYTKLARSMRGEIVSPLDEL